MLSVKQGGIKYHFSVFGMSRPGIEPRSPRPLANILLIKPMARIYIYLYIHGAFNKFPDFFVVAFKIVADSWKFSMLLLYILWDDWPNFMISASNEQLQQQLEYTLLKPDCHSWLISKMQSDTLEEPYAIKFCFKLVKKCHRNVWNASDCFSTILHESSIRFLSGIRD